MVFTKIPANDVCVGCKILDVCLFGNKPEMAKEITRIIYRGVDRFGENFVQGYHKTGTETGEMSFVYSKSEDFYLVEKI